ncbi:hypothetical protein PINS_up007712 [Pythium insidiosum]|nr:hypothetical protein PINS_up007712 [Pythium insidiosum]
MIHQTIMNMPKKQAFVTVFGGVMAVSYLTFAQQRYSGKDNGGAAPGEPKTTSAEWQAASVEFGKVQKANPIRHFRG